MPVTNKPSVTTHQVGATVFFILNGFPKQAVVEQTFSEVQDADNNNTGEQVDSYYLKGYSEKFYNSQLATSKANLKTLFNNLVDAMP